MAMFNLSNDNLGPIGTKGLGLRDFCPEEGRTVHFIQTHANVREQE